MQRLLALFTCLALAQGASAQSNVLVVAEDAGPDVDYTSLQAAIDAASPTDVILVREGSYQAPHLIGIIDRFRISKSARIVAEEGAEVILTDGVSVSGLDADESVLLRGLIVDFSDDTQEGNAIRFGFSEGALWLEDCELRAQSSQDHVFGSEGGWVDAMLVEAEGPALVTRTTIQGGGNILILGNIQGVPLVAKGGSNVFVYDSIVETDPIIASGLFGPPVLSPGVSVTDSFLFASGSTFHGGMGIDEDDEFIHVCGSDGGPALLLADGETPSDAVLWDSELIGGPPGVDTVCQEAGQGVPSVVEEGTLTELGGTARSLTAPATAVAGSGVTLAMSGEEGDFVLLAYSQRFEPLWVPALNGALGPADPTLFLVPGVVPLGGQLALGITALSPAPRTEALSLYLQAAFFDGVEFVLSSATATTFLAP